MKKYHKIQTVFERNSKGDIILGEYSLEEFEYLKNNKWVFTEKIDGTNIRVMWNGEKITFAGKTDKADIPVHLQNKLETIFFGKEKLFDEIFAGINEVCLYGEGYGCKIQKAGKYYLPNDVDFILFDIFINSWWLKRETIENIASKLGIKIVPIVGYGTLNEMIELARKGFKSMLGDLTAEGIVARPLVELKDRGGRRIITKIKHKDFNLSKVN